MGNDATALAQVRKLPPPPPPAEGDDVDWSREGYKLVARYRKARKLANRLLADANTSAVEVEALGAYVVARRLLAELAGTNTPSQVTWALVVELLKEAGR